MIPPDLRFQDWHQFAFEGFTGLKQDGFGSDGFFTYAGYIKSHPVLCLIMYPYLCLCLNGTDGELIKFRQPARNLDLGLAGFGDFKFETV